MKIGIDTRPLQGPDRYRGIGSVTFGLIAALLKFFPENTYYFYAYPEDKAVISDLFSKYGQFVLKELGKQNKHINLSQLKVSFFKSKFFLGDKLDFFLSTNFLLGVPVGKFRTVSIVYDLIPVFYPEERYTGETKSFKESICQRISQKHYNFRLSQGLSADLILAISENTKRDIIQHFEVDEQRLKVFPLGIAPEFLADKKLSNPFEVLKAYNISKPFLLYVGGIESRKNIFTLLKVFVKVSQFLPQLRLVFVNEGMKNVDSKTVRFLKEKIAHLGLKEKVILIGFIPTACLAAFYQQAELLLFPSLYEGFGLPILEAMACGCPVVCSNTSSLPEVAGGAAVLVNPQDIEEIAKKTRDLIENERERKQLVERGKIWARGFTWEASARKVISILNEEVF